MINGCELLLKEFLEDPEYLAFTSDKTENAEIYIMDDKGTVRKRLTDNSYDNYQLAWSADGSKIIFAAFEGLLAGEMY